MHRPPAFRRRLGPSLESVLSSGSVQMQVSRALRAITQKLQRVPRGLSSVARHGKAPVPERVGALHVPQGQRVSAVVCAVPGRPPSTAPSAILIRVLDRTARRCRTGTCTMHGRIETGKAPQAVRMAEGLIGNAPPSVTLMTRGDSRDGRLSFFVYTGTHADCSGRTDSVIIIGAGLGRGGSPDDGDVLEREPVPGGRAGLLETDEAPLRHRADHARPDRRRASTASASGWRTGSTWSRSTPLYRAFYPDGSTLDVHADPAAMADEIARVCGPAEAAGYRRYVDFVPELYRYEMRDFIDRNIDSPLDLLTPEPGPARRRSAASAGWRPRSRSTSRTRGPSGCSRSRRCTPGSRRTTRSRSTRSSPTWTRWPGVFFPKGGMHAVPRALAGAAEKHGVDIRYGTEVTRVETRGGRAPWRCTPPTASGSPCDVVVLNPDLPVAYRELLGREPRSVRRLTYSPSCFLLLAGSTATYTQTAHHNIPFGHAWTRGVRRDHRRPADERPVVPGHQPDARPTRRWRRTAADLLRAVPDAEPRRPASTGAVDGTALPRRGGARRWRRAATSASATASRSST